jgi:ribosomal protein S18 acetylase RimI-like enzyme
MRFGSHHANITTEIETLYIQEPFVRCGIGSKLLNHAKNVAMLKHKDQSMWLTVNSQNKRAIAFYHSHGFTQDGITYFEIGGKKHENIIMVIKS